MISYKVELFNGEDLYDWALNNGWSIDWVIDKLEENDLWQEAFEFIEAYGELESDTELNDLLRFGLDEGGFFEDNEDDEDEDDEDEDDEDEDDEEFIDDETMLEQQYQEEEKEREKERKIVLNYRGYFSKYQYLKAMNKPKNTLVHDIHSWVLKADGLPVNHDGSIEGTFFQSLPQWEIKTKPKRASKINAKGEKQ